MLYGLCDCNSFYASCERLYRPDLWGKPVVVLSNNDGIIVALTKEAKALGLKRGDALFKVRDVVRAGNVAVFSSNYPLYQDISDGVMATLRSLVPGRVTSYSIDESFFTVKEADGAWCRNLQAEMVRDTGMPVAIAVARTKTLAKAGEQLVKHTRTPAIRVYPEDEEELLRKTAIADVWGIGWQNAPRLYRAGVETAWDLTRRDDHWIRKRLGITGLRTVQELRGVNCISVEEPVRKTMMSGISFGDPVTTEEALSMAAARHCMTLSEKLVERDLLAGTLTVLAMTDRFRSDFIAPSGSMRLPVPTTYPPLLASACRTVIRRIWKPGRYKKCLIFATDLAKGKCRQMVLGETENDLKRIAREDRLAETVEEIHGLYGRSSLLIASTGAKVKSDLMSQSRLSPRYTTRIEDIPVCNARKDSCPPTPFASQSKA